MRHPRMDAVSCALLALPIDLEQSARGCGALRRRRKVSSALEMARLILSYACSNLSLRSLAAPAGLRPESLYRMLLRSERWLEELLLAALQKARPAPLAGGPLKLMVADATVLCGPGAKGPQWRVHAYYDPLAARLSGLQLTNERAAESLARSPGGEGILLLGDRGLSYARSYARARQAGSQVLVRIEPASIRLLDGQGRRFDVGSWARQAPQGGCELALFLPVPEQESPEPVRVLAYATPKGATVLMTSLSPQQANSQELKDLYRLRWQVELEFKRLKSLLGLGELPCKPGAAARCWILARLLVAALAEGMLVNPPTGGGEGLRACGGR